MLRNRSHGSLVGQEGWACWIGLGMEFLRLDVVGALVVGAASAPKLGTVEMASSQLMPVAMKAQWFNWLRWVFVATPEFDELVGFSAVDPNLELSYWGTPSDMWTEMSIGWLQWDLGATSTFILQNMEWQFGWLNPHFSTYHGGQTLHHSTIQSTLWQSASWLDPRFQPTSSYH